MCDVMSSLLHWKYSFLLHQILKVLAIPTRAFNPHSLTRGSSRKPLSLDFSRYKSVSRSSRPPEDPWQVLWDIHLQLLSKVGVRREDFKAQGSNNYFQK